MFILWSIQADFKTISSFAAEINDRKWSERHSSKLLKISNGLTAVYWTKKVPLNTQQKSIQPFKDWMFNVNRELCLAIFTVSTFWKEISSKTKNLRKIGHQADLGIEVIILSKFNSLEADIFSGVFETVQIRRNKKQSSWRRILWRSSLSVKSVAGVATWCWHQLVKRYNELD